MAPSSQNIIVLNYSMTITHQDFQEWGVRDAVRTPPPCLGRWDVKHNDHHDDSDNDNDFDEGNNDNDLWLAGLCGAQSGSGDKKISDVTLTKGVSTSKSDVTLTKTSNGSKV